MEEFFKYLYEHILLVKKADDGKILIVFQYVGDLIYTGNGQVMFDQFKEFMMAEI